MRRHVILLALSLALLSTALRAETFTEGFVTRIGPSGEFDVNSMRVLACPKTAITIKYWENADTGGKLVSSTVNALPSLFLGQPVEVVGEVTHNSTEIKATPPSVERGNAGQPAS